MKRSLVLTDIAANLLGALLLLWAGSVSEQPNPALKSVRVELLSRCVANDSAPFPDGALFCYVLTDGKLVRCDETSSMVSSEFSFHPDQPFSASYVVSVNADLAAASQQFLIVFGPVASPSRGEFHAVPFQVDAAISVPGKEREFRTLHCGEGALGARHWSLDVGIILREQVGLSDPRVIRND